MPVDRAPLGAFLRSRRDRLSPAQAGIRAFPGPRRVPGLRKEELAVLAGLSPDYYSRLEQGRQANISAEVLEALARALRLDEVEHAHLHDLAAPTTRRRLSQSGPAQRPDPGLLRLMDTLEHVPVLLLGNRGDVLACNLLLQAVLTRELAPGMSFVRWLFQDPVARERIVNWADFAAAAVAGLRGQADRAPCSRTPGVRDRVRRPAPRTGPAARHLHGPAPLAHRPDAASPRQLAEPTLNAERNAGLVPRSARSARNWPRPQLMPKGQGGLRRGPQI